MPSDKSETTGSIRRRLVAARKLIEKPESWTQGTYREHHSSGVKYCADGALLYCKGKSGTYSPALKILEAVVGCQHVVAFNDAIDRTHAEVLAAFDRAISECAP